MDDELLKKLLLIAVGALLAVCGWYMRAMYVEVKELREEVTRLTISVEATARFVEPGNPTP